MEISSYIKQKQSVEITKWRRNFKKVFCIFKNAQITEQIWYLAIKLKLKAFIFICQTFFCNFLQKTLFLKYIVSNNLKQVYCEI